MNLSPILADESDQKTIRWGGYLKLNMVEKIPTLLLLASATEIEMRNAKINMANVNLFRSLHLGTIKNNNFLSIIIDILFFTVSLIFLWVHLNYSLSVTLYEWSKLKQSTRRTGYLVFHKMLLLKKMLVLSLQINDWQFSSWCFSTPSATCFSPYRQTRGNRPLHISTGADNPTGNSHALHGKTYGRSCRWPLFKDRYVEQSEIWCKTYRASS